MTDKDRKRIRLFWKLKGYRGAPSCDNCALIRIGNRGHKDWEQISTKNQKAGTVNDKAFGDNRFCDYYNHEPSKKPGEIEGIILPGQFIWARVCKHWQFNYYYESYWRK